MTFSDSMSNARSILIVEDEAMIAMMLEEYLGVLGHDVRGVAATLAEADALMEEGEGLMGLAILDCFLGEEEVWPLADRLAERGVPLILSSGGSISTIPERFASCPMLQKPYTIAALSEVLSQIP